MASQFGPPQVDFSQLASIPDSFAAGRKFARDQRVEDTRNRVLNELTPNADGTVDFNRAMTGMLSVGDLAGAKAVADVAAATGGKATDEMREYALSQRQGFKGSFTDWKTGLKRAGATNVNVNTGEKSYDTTLGKSNAENFIEYQKAGRNATGQIQSLNQMENLTKDPNFYSGVGAERFALPLKQVISRWGGDPNAATSMETFRSLSNKATLDTMGGSLGSGFSNADRDFVVGQTANLGNTPEGNRTLIGIHRKVAERTQQIAKMARDYASKNGGRLDVGFDDEMARYANANPLFPQTQGTQPQAAPAQAAPARSSPPASAPNARQGRDGKFYVPDPNRPGKYLQVVE